LNENVDYKVLDHVADLGVEIRAPSLEDLFVGAARALFDLLGTLESTRGSVVETIDIEGQDLVELLHDWLSDLLFRSAARRRVFCEFRICSLDSNHLRAEAVGEVFDPDRHSIEREIKAVTFHNLEIVEQEQEWRATVIFDV
jgi:SHS2 domain-containing protein